VRARMFHEHTRRYDAAAEGASLDRKKQYSVVAEGKERVSAVKSCG
jgi:hypothetical protein